jgi:hypothetical protein
MLRHNVGPDGDPDDIILNLWTATVDIDAVTHVDFADCHRYGRTADELVGDDYTATRALADAVHAGGAAAMVVPSAALPGTHNLIVFGVRLLYPYAWEPLIPEEIPTGHLTDGARVPAEVTDHVRWFGATHSALEQWKATGAYDRFDEPIATRW